MRLASLMKSGHSSSLLWPEWVKTIDDVPADLSNALEHSFKILSWYENLGIDELPPQWMWHLDWELETWFEQVDAQRKNPRASDDREEVPMMSNEHAAHLRG